MSRFANPSVAKRYVLPDGCQCPGAPHDEDWIEFRTELGTADIVAMQAADSVEQIRSLIKSWNLQDDDGKEVEPDHEHVGLLFSETWDAIGDWIAENVRANTLPNVSGAHSANGSRASASRTRLTPTKR